MTRCVKRRIGHPLIPDNPDGPYDMEVIRHVVDDNQFWKFRTLGAEYHRRLFARLGGRPVGIIAQQPTVLAGVLDVEANQKGARFVRFYGANVPLIVFRMCPASCRHRRTRRHHPPGHKLLYAFCEATVPKLTVIVRKAYGGAYCVMNPPPRQRPTVLAWPVPGSPSWGRKAPSTSIFRRGSAGRTTPSTRKSTVVQDYRTCCTDPYVAASQLYPTMSSSQQETALISSMRWRCCKRKRRSLPPKHGNIPL